MTCTRSLHFGTSAKQHEINKFKVLWRMKTAVYFPSISKLEYSCQRFIEVNFPCEVFVSISDRIQCHFLGQENDGDLMSLLMRILKKPLTIALKIALQVVRTLFGFHLRECMGSYSPLVKTKKGHNKAYCFFSMHLGLDKSTIKASLSISIAPSL